MAATAEDIVSTSRLARELRIPESVDESTLLSGILSSAVDFVSSYTYPLINERRWHRFSATLNSQRSITIYMPGIIQENPSQLAMGYWKRGDSDSIEPPNTITGFSDFTRNKLYLDLYPPSGGWPSDVDRLGVKVLRGWRAYDPGDPNDPTKPEVPSSYRAETIVRAIILYARELYEDSTDIPKTHPFWSLIRSSQFVPRMT